MSEPPATGLCGTCRHSRRVVSGKGSTFLLCRRSKTDSRYPRYPRLPVAECLGWEAGSGAEDGPPEREGPAAGSNGESRSTHSSGTGS